ncbi:hypothetical protein [Curtobacterium flaccumfaciens]|uniref:hypothetical protein n=1 Tax=Curtobacterium flaccumfaciens TaxID=2035 RepID=UPI001BDDF1D8|nr:hypothetical protein [Curtobacterium flaccumfaciens]MBT1605674.1 hypothetical protein [Curtobacterium flaccumfaciens pv. betae]MBT1656453.1 hypothetical protein [Curtobacterium flaccumfaciens pv. betae]MCS0470852.1 hypothetical protein [Curtobacterium flaccumfaciens pv. betae]MCS0475656.1 hypothetical protein [Curtobacterium flaccumfaciens pv. betae]MCS0477264.1 hypothetical protein [Curtobacterium flaccumfaciens pv. betae]
MGRTRIVVAVVGVLVVALYAALLAVDALVLDPLAAVPGATLAEIHAELTQQGFPVGADVATVVGIAVVGVLFAAGLSVLLLITRAPAHVIAAVLLAVVVMGTPMSFVAAIALGMDVADAYGVGGGAHTIWSGVLYVTSLVALIAIPVVLVVGQSVHVRRAALRARAV